jgi:predicted Zn-dependent protease
MELPMLEEIEKQDVQLLADAGFLALSYGDLDRAEAIFKGVQVARPDSEAGPLGVALTDMARGNVQAAVDRLQALTPSDPVRLYLAIALGRSGDRQRAEELFRELIASASGTAFAEIAAAHLKTLHEGTLLL